MEINKSSWRENIESIAVAVVVILFIQVFIARPFIVEGPSMEPTLWSHERLVVDRLVYSFRPPATGDVVVIIPPGDPKRKYVKRVIAGPNQSIEIRNSEVYVDGRRLDEPYIKEKTFQDFPYHQVPDKSVFVMGDNRNVSLDSRNEEVVGYVPIENVVGKVFFVFWPLPKIRVLATPPEQAGTAWGEH